MLSTLFELDVDKHETRSDWLQRPLTDAQQRYAAEDVVYLDIIYQRLAVGNGTKSWAGVTGLARLMPSQAYLSASIT